MRPLARLGVHPNWVTGVSILLTLAVIPLCATGHFLAGFLCAYGMSVLDSVDGKLARLTFTDSKLGNILDQRSSDDGVQTCGSSDLRSCYPRWR